jgi:protein phosphatase
MEFKLKVYSIWEFGQRKDAEGNPHQEDSLCPAYGAETANDRTFILCDGMGGHDAGEVASATVCDAMNQSILNDGHDAEGVFTDDDFRQALTAAYDALDKKDSGAVKKMGTTMTFLKLHKEGATIAHIGDSRVYHIRPGKTEHDTVILHRTEDHSLVNDLIKIGELTREEARHSKQKNVITRAMQPNSGRPKADIYHTSDIKPGDYFYLCSDGMLEQDEMEDGTVLKRIFSGQVDSDEKRISILRGATDNNRDNHTAFVVHILDVTGVKASASVPPLASKHVAEVEEEVTQDDDIAVEKKSHGNRWVRFACLFVVILFALFMLHRFVPSREKDDSSVETVSPHSGKKISTPQKPARADKAPASRETSESQVSREKQETQAAPASQKPQGASSVASKTDSVKKAMNQSENESASSGASASASGSAPASGSVSGNSSTPANSSSSMDNTIEKIKKQGKK